MRPPACEPMPERSSHTASSDPDVTRVLRASGTIGRDQELATLGDMFGRTRVVSIWGPPGVGKSRLARTYARAAGRHAICELATVHDIDVVEHEIARALGCEPGPQESPAALRERLERVVAEHDAIVIVLDDVDEIGGLPTLLGRFARRQASAVDVVLTSRTRIDVPGGTNLRVEGLDAVSGRQLFIERAEEARRDFQADDTASIDRLVELVDGLPLGIELAAARVRVMAPADLARRVGERFDVLKSRQRKGERHESVRTAFDESWAALDDEQREVLAACSVFDDLFDLEAAEQVIGPHVDAFVLDVLEELVERALVQTLFVGDSAKFSLLRTVREYASEKLRGSGKFDAISRSFDVLLLQRAEESSSRMLGPDGAAAFGAIDDQHSILVGLLRRFVQAEDFALASRLLLALRWHIVFRGPLESYEDALRDTLANTSNPNLRGQLAAIWAEAQILRGDRTRAADVLDRHAKNADDPRTKLVVERVASMVDPNTGAAELCQRLEELVERAQSLGDRFVQARALERLGLARTQANDVDGAWLALTEARDLFASIGGEVFATSCATGLGYVELRLGKLDSAIKWFSDAVDLHSRFETHFLGSAARFNLGVALHCAGDLENASQNLSAALESWRNGGFARYRVPGLVRLALVECEAGSIDSARTALSEAVRLGKECQDHHNAAIAYVERAALDHSRGRPVQFEELEQMVPGIAAGADPDAFASALVLLTVRAGIDGYASLGYVNRLEELTAMFSDGEPYIRDVIGTLRDIARAWHSLASASSTRDEATRRQLVARAWESGGDLLQGSNLSAGSNPFVRLWSERLREFGEEFAGFAPLQETFRAVLLVHSDAQWYRVDDRPPVDLSTRRPLRLLMRGLVELAQRDPTAGLDVDGLAEAGWPGETLNLSTRRNRVYTAVRFLREMDLEGILVTSDAGYGFADDIALRVTDEELPSA